MKKLKNISVSRITILVLIATLINKPIIYLILGLFLFIYNYFETCFYILLVLLILLTNTYTRSFVPLGIVEKKVNNYYIADSLIYKTKISNKDIKIGDVIYYNNLSRLNNENYLKKNIIYETNDFKVISNFKLRNYIYQIIENSSTNIRIVLDKFIYNINDYDDLTYNLGFGLAIYYLIKVIQKKNSKFSLIFIIIYSLIFYFDIKFYLLVTDIILIEINRKDHIWIVILLILLINKYLLFNYSLLIPILLKLYSYFSNNISFRMYLTLIETYMFGYVNLLSIFLFRYFVIFQIVILILCLIYLFIPSISFILEIVIRIYSFINNIDLNVRGSLSLFGILFYLIINYLFIIKSEIIKYILFILILISPINNPMLTISFIDVGQGDATLIQLPFRKTNILIDTGSKYNYYKLSKFLYSKGIYDIDYLVITHNDSDHNGNIDNLLRDFNINEIIDKPKDININSLILKNLYIGSFDNDNDNSLVYWMNINGISYLFTGDISSDAERVLVNKYGNIDVDVLKVSHHGSITGTSKYFLGSTLPLISIISTSGQYNHPSNKVINRLNNYLSNYFITKDDGNICIYSSKLINILKTGRGDFVIIR